MKIIGVSRGSKYSPNHVDNDAAIFNRVADVLRMIGYEVDVFTETEFTDRQIEGDVIFDMARDSSAIERLKELERRGALVVNSAFGIENCVRRQMTELLLGNGIPHPKSWIIATEKSLLPADVVYPCWIKRGDSHAMVKQDVSYAVDKNAALQILDEFHSRNIPDAVINEHLQGDLIKFYGVHGTDFFYWFYPSSCSHSKFGLEKINGEARGIPFDEMQLKQYADKAAKVLRVPVYGGDCIVTEPGVVKIIDFNDWPSFARCRDEAGEQIANCIHQLVKQQNIG